MSVPHKYNIGKIPEQLWEKISWCGQRKDKQVHPTTKVTVSEASCLKGSQTEGGKAPPMQVTGKIKDCVKIRITLNSANVTVPELIQYCC